MSKFYRIDFYVPSSHLEKVKNALFGVGAGKLGDYDSCCWQVLGKGQFRPLPGSLPFIGKTMTVEYVEEYKVEMIFPLNLKEKVISALRSAHPYETPAYHIIEISIE